MGRVKILALWSFTWILTGLGAMLVPPWGLGSGVWGLGSGVWSLGFREVKTHLVRQRGLLGFREIQLFSGVRFTICFFFIGEDPGALELHVDPHGVGFDAGPNPSTLNPQPPVPCRHSRSDLSQSHPLGAL